MCLAAAEITDAQARPGGAWVSAVLTEPNTHGDGGRTVLAMWSVSTPSPQPVVLLSDPVPMAGRALTGGVHCWHPDGDRVCVVTRDGLVEVQVLGDRAVVAERCEFDVGDGASFATPIYTPDGSTLLVVVNWSELWARDCVTGSTQLVHGPHDFLVDPSGHIRGDAVVWSRPHMSWTTSTVWPRSARDAVSVQQPRISHDGRSHGWIDDASGYWNVVIDADHLVDRQVRIDDSCEHAGPVWGPGQRSWCVSPDGRFVAFTRNEDGYSTLNVYDRTRDERVVIGRGVHGCLSWSGTTLAAVRQGARVSSQLLCYRMSVDLSAGEMPARTIIHDTRDERWRHVEDDVLIEPTVVRTDRDIVYRLYEPTDDRSCRGTIVWIHGGPIDQWQVTFRPRFSYWISRGWRIAVVDHRGTTGHGRAFREALHGQWGIADVDDTIDVIAHLASTHPQSGPTVVMGASAGGFTALHVAARTTDIAAVVVSYPVCDLEMLLKDNDPFEGHYTPTLVGADVVGDAEKLAMRSPVGHGMALAAVPILVFHGDSDHSVPLAHSEQLVRAVEAHGGTIELHVMQGEGHGFKMEESIRHEYDVTTDFLSRLLEAHR